MMKLGSRASGRGRSVGALLALGFAAWPLAAAGGSSPSVPPDVTGPPSSTTTTEPVVTTEPPTPTAPAVVDVVISPAEIGHEAVVLNWQSYPEDVTVTNNGVEVAVTGISVEGPFLVRSDTCTGATLATGATCTFETLFENKDNGTIAGRLTLTLSTGDTVSAELFGGILHQSTNPWGGPGVGLGGGGPAPIVVGLGSLNQVILPFGNPFGSNMTIGSFQMSRISPFGFAGASRPSVLLTEGDFSVDTGDCDGAVLAPGESCSVSVTFQPTSVGASAIQVSVDTNVGRFSTTMTAEGVAAAPSVLPATR